MRVSVRVTPELAELVSQANQKVIDSTPICKERLIKFLKPGEIIGNYAIAAYRAGLEVSSPGGVRSEKDLEDAFCKYREKCDVSRQVRCGAGVIDVVDMVGVYEVKFGLSVGGLTGAIKQVLRYHGTLSPAEAFKKSPYVVAEAYPVSKKRLIAEAASTGVSFLKFDGTRVVYSALAEGAERYEIRWLADSLLECFDGRETALCRPPSWCKETS